MLLERLAEHQRTIGAIADRGTTLLQTGSGADAMAISKIRWEMVRALTAYQQFKHREIFDPAIMRGNAQLQHMAEAMKDDCVAIGNEFTGYVKHWGTVGTAECWTEYRTAALAMVARIRRHLAQEQRAVTSLFRGARVSGSAVWPVRAG